MNKTHVYGSRSSLELENLSCSEKGTFTKRKNTEQPAPFPAEGQI